VKVIFLTMHSEITYARRALEEGASGFVLKHAAPEELIMAIRTVLEDVADIVEARSGEEALRHLLKHEFAVILLDVYMPGMDGYETAQMIRQRDQSKRIPIIFLSAVNKENEHLIRGYAMGAVDYVFKPVEPVVLRSKVAVFVDLFLMTREIQRKAQQEQQLLDAARPHWRPPAIPQRSAGCDRQIQEENAGQRRAEFFPGRPSQVAYPARTTPHS